MGGPSLGVVQDCVFGRKHHGGALALGGSFRPKIDFSHITDAGTKPTYRRPFVLWVPGYAYHTDSYGMLYAWGSDLGGCVPGLEETRKIVFWGGEGQ